MRARRSIAATIAAATLFCPSTPLRSFFRLPVAGAAEVGKNEGSAREKRFPRRSRRSRRRLLIPADESIADVVQNAHDDGELDSLYTLRAEVADDVVVIPPPSSIDEVNEYYELHVREASPAVTPETTIGVDGIVTGNVNGDDVSTMLVSDVDGVLALIAVDLGGGGDVRGIIRGYDDDDGGGGGGMKFVQNGDGGMAVVKTAQDFTPPAWSCGFGGERDDGPNNATIDGGGGSDGYHHFLHDHDDGQHRQYDHSNTTDALYHLQRNLRGSVSRLGKRRRVLGGVEAYSYWVDVYVEIDYSLCADNGETCANGIGPRTINYVNALFVGANTIYETEIDTHLNVLHIDLNRNYDTATDTMQALTTMRLKFASDEWHFTSPSGIKPDLHHALLSKDLGGGVAYLGTICNPNYGFGLSASLSGNYRGMGNAVVWDMMVFMHEVGHNFNSGHTHDGGYSPRVDTCGCPQSNGRCTDPCPSQLPLAKSATIMSYCHLCSGGYPNIDYTFGGKYSGTGSRGSIFSYSNSPLAGTVSNNPRQVNARMWNHVSTRGICTQPNNPSITATSPTNVPTITTPRPTSRPTSLPTRITPAPTTPRPTSMPSSPPTEITPAPMSSSTMMSVEVLILTDDYPAETSWTLVNQCGQQTSMSGGPYNKARTWISVKSLVPSGSYLFAIKDDYGDGICCGYGRGWYKILVNGVVEHTSNGKFTRAQTKTFGSCALGQNVVEKEHVNSRRKKGIFES